MTSSLVGSEMCIRDRANSPPLPIHPSSVAPNALLAGIHLTLVEDYPVSYTHLTLPTICSV
eukprot:7457595-Prorocentrum_lima.AAC.1